MPNDISVSAVSAASESYSPAAAAQPVAAARNATTAAATGPGLPNPSIQLDPALNIVVIQLHNSKGDITNSMPSLRQLDAYRTGQLSVPSAATPPPPVVPAAPSAAAAASTPTPASTSVAAPQAAVPAATVSAAPAPTPAAAADPATGSGTSAKSGG